MFSKSTWLHLRLPFSWVLAPVFLFAAAQTGAYHTRGFWLAALCQFLFLYPASHAFNSYYDRDTESIAGIKKPPPVENQLLGVALLLDAVALALAWAVGPLYFALVLIYGLASKAYSHPSLRWKAHPFWGWAVVTFMQGAFTYWMSASAQTGSPADPLWIWPAVIASLWIGSSYPLTQVYQHAEDARRGDRTISLKLGVRGTLLFAAVGFALAQALLAAQAAERSEWPLFWAVQAGFAPSAFYFLNWVYRHPTTATYEQVMKMSWLSATGVNVCLLLYIITSPSTSH